MKILVFGATGRVGVNVTNYALAQGHEVTAFIRDRTKITPQHPHLTTVEGDIYHPVSVAAALDGEFDAVVNTVGVDPFKPSTIVTDSVRTVVGAMSEAGISRYLGITGTAQMPNNIGGAISAAVIRRSPIRHAVRDHDGALRIITHSELAWTLAGCPYIRDGALTGQYRLSSSFPGGFKTISPQDVADFLIRELTSRQHVQQIVGIWY